MAKKTGAVLDKPWPDLAEQTDPGIVGEPEAAPVVASLNDQPPAEEPPPPPAEPTFEERYDAAVETVVACRLRYANAKTRAKYAKEDLELALDSLQRLKRPPADQAALEQLPIPGTEAEAEAEEELESTGELDAELTDGAESADLIADDDDPEDSE